MNAKWSNIWFKRDFLPIYGKRWSQPDNILKGPRQVGKTSLLETIAGIKSVYFDDLSVRSFCARDPKLFLDQYRGQSLLLDEATLVPELFPELKRRVDEARRNKSPNAVWPIWITGSNQTLLRKTLRESLAGRASYFDLNTLSIHEIGLFHLSEHLMSGGWPQLRAEAKANPTRYLDDFISTFVEKDIVVAAGIEKSGAFAKALYLIAGRIAQLLNLSDISKTIGVEVNTLRSWVAVLEENGILRQLPSYSSNINQRLIKAPKCYFEDVGLAVRLQGWSEAQPAMLSPYFGALLENIALTEITRYFENSGHKPKIYYLRSKEKVEIDFLNDIGNQRFIAAEVKNQPEDFTKAQIDLMESLKVKIVAHWVLNPSSNLSFGKSIALKFEKIWDALEDSCGLYRSQ